MELAADGSVDVTAAGFDGFQVKPCRRDRVTGHAEDDHTTEQVGHAITAGAGMLRLDPDLIAVGRRAGHRRPQIRYRGQDLRPVAANLIASGEAARWMCRRLVAVVRREARDDRVEVAGVDCPVQPLDYRGGRRRRLRVVEHDRLLPLGKIGYSRLY